MVDLLLRHSAGRKVARGIALHLRVAGYGHQAAQHRHGMLSDPGDGGLLMSVAAVVPRQVQLSRRYLTHNVNQIGTLVARIPVRASHAHSGDEPPSGLVELTQVVEADLCR
ncbi:hypothetical protein D3C73_1349470 [compost metagenome]